MDGWTHRQPIWQTVCVLSHMWGVAQTSNDPKKSDMLMLMVPLFPQSIPKKRSLLLEMAKQTKLWIYGNRLLLVCTATKMRGNLFASLQKNSFIIWLWTLLTSGGPGGIRHYLQECKSFVLQLSMTTSAMVYVAGFIQSIFLTGPPQK